MQAAKTTIPRGFQREYISTWDRECDTLFLMKSAINDGRKQSKASTLHIQARKPEKHSTV